MEQINDDMDELFRRAAEGYPLNTDSSDWNSVVKKLSENSVNANPASSENKNYKHLLWLLLLLPLGWLYTNYNNRKEKQVTSSSKNISVKDSTHILVPENNNSTSTAVKLGNVLPGKTNVLINSTGIKSNVRGKLRSVFTAISNPSVYPDKPTPFNTDPLDELPHKRESKLIPETNTEKNIEESKKEASYLEIKPNSSPDIPASSSFDTTINKKMTTSKKQIKKQKERGVYAGLMLSPDISTVKFQSVKNMGISFGLVAGYKLNNRVSIETGIAWDKKYYYSDGIYFSTKRVYQNPNAKIINVDGICYMIEIPLSVRYDLTKGKTYFSTSGGISSYIMKKENYDYVIVYNNGQPYSRSSTYNNSSTNMLAVANFSFAFNRTLKSNTTLRIEPYIKIPLKGIGIGNLPILSSGFNIAVIKRLSR